MLAQPRSAPEFRRILRAVDSDPSVLEVAGSARCPARSAGLAAAIGGRLAGEPNAAAGDGDVAAQSSPSRSRYRSIGVRQGNAATAARSLLAAWRASQSKGPSKGVQPRF